ncbi:hypothetical protein WMF11_27415 [Sorangium sp. So ce295]|uniref:hypothetical protein n=1 Tax=Sorangium sp. So ce295 TaxID=3133295 RepID=UPI003F607813
MSCRATRATSGRRKRSSDPSRAGAALPSRNAGRPATSRRRSAIIELPFSMIAGRSRVNGARRRSGVTSIKRRPPAWAMSSERAPSDGLPTGKNARKSEMPSGVITAVLTCMCPKLT